MVELLVRNLRVGVDTGEPEPVRGGRGRGAAGLQAVHDGNLPILAVCYTNHALDQFLESLLDVGLTGIVRVGGGRKNERVAELNLRNGKRVETCPALTLLAQPLGREDASQGLLVLTAHLPAPSRMSSSQPRLPDAGPVQA